jgi:phage terminase large subunit-like protein
VWDTSCPDWEQRLLGGRSLVPDLPLNLAERDRALRIFNRLKLPDVIGLPPMSTAGGDWFRDIVGALFGAYDPISNRRMIQEFFLLVPKKNGKSSYAAAVMVVAMIVNRRPSAEFLLISSTKTIADIAYKQAAGTIRADPELDKLFHLQQHIRQITHRKSGATLQIKAADTDVITGSKSTGILVDETHVFSKKSNAADIFLEIRGALAARPDGFMIQITTQSKDPPSGVFKEELSLSRDVRDGKIQLPRLAVLYELPEALAKDGGWKDPTYWPAVNPNLGRSVDVEFLKNQLLTAEREGTGKLALLASQHFNVQVGLALRTDSWVGAEFWERRADPLIKVNTILARCEVVVVGLDGGGLDDLYGLTILGREAQEIEIEADLEETEAGPEDAREPIVGTKRVKRWLSWSHAWAHRIVLERRKSIESKLLDLEKAGELTILDDGELAENGLPADIAQIVAIVERIKDAGLLCAVAVDPAGLGELIEALADIGVVQENRESGRNYVIGAPQGYALMNALKTTERKLANGTLLHADQVLMDWCVANLKIEATATAIRATKQNAGDAKIDPAMALFDAVTVMATNPDTPRSVYEERGLLVL